MSPLSDLVRRVITGNVTPSQVLNEVRALAPASAQHNRAHAWWSVDGDEILGTLIRASKDKFFLSAQAAVQSALRSKGKVVSERIAGLQVFNVLPVQQADAILTEKIVSQAMPTEFVEPTWDDELPTLARFRCCAEAEYLGRLLTKNGWNLSVAAREANVARQTLYALVKRHGLIRPGCTIETSTETDVAKAA